jgi:hypothetical protein
MTPKQVQRKLVVIQKRTASAYAALKALQDTCAHPTPTYKYCGSSGSYDPSNDSYWIDWHCPDCNKKWNTPQHRQHTDKYPNAVRIR